MAPSIAIGLASTSAGLDTITIGIGAGNSRSYGISMGKQTNVTGDYGIAIGLGGEYSHPKVGHFLLEARYYYGLGNIYGSSKRDFFSKSNYGNIVIKATYLFDILRTKKPK